MKTFKDLIIRGNSKNDMKVILKEIIAKIPKNWKFLIDDVERHSKNTSKPKDEVGCFESPIINNVSAYVWLNIFGNELKVTNIVPARKKPLSVNEYNDILDMFYQDCIEPIKNIKNCEIILTDGIKDIEEIAGVKTYEALLKWEESCNHSTGNTHPSDFLTWTDFISTAFTEKSDLTSEDLERWLIEEKNWNNDELVSKLASDFEYAKSILEHYVKRNSGS